MAAYLIIPTSKLHLKAIWPQLLPTQDATDMGSNLDIVLKGFKMIELGPPLAEVYHGGRCNTYTGPNVRTK